MNSFYSKKVLREFGLVFGFGFPILFGLIIPFTNGHSIKIWTIFLGILFSGLAIFKPTLLYYPYKIWMKFGKILGWINSRIILGVIFVLVVIPTSLIMKFLGYDPLQLKNNDKVSYKIRKSYRKIDLNRIF